MNYLIISKHTIQSLQIRKPNKNKYDCCCRGLVVQYIRGIYRGCFLLLKVFLNFRLLLSHIYSIYVMRTPRTSTNVRVLTVVLPALLADVAEFCLVCHVCVLCCSCNSFWSVCFLFVFPYVVHAFFSLFPPVHVFGGRRKGPYSFPLLSLVFNLLSLSYCVLSL